MKHNQEKIKRLVEAFLWSIFIGWVGISIGLGAIYPPLNYIAKPFVCPDGQMTFKKLVDQAAPNRTFYSADWACTKREANSQPINPSPYAGVIYGLLCFPVFLLSRSYFKRLEEQKT